MSTLLTQNYDRVMTYVAENCEFDFNFTKRRVQFSVHWPNPNGDLVLSSNTLDNLVNLILEKFFEEKAQK